MDMQYFRRDIEEEEEGPFTSKVYYNFLMHHSCCDFIINKNYKTFSFTLKYWHVINR